MKTLKNIIRNENAIAYGYLIIAAFLILGSIVWIEFQPVFNQLFTQYNQDVSDGIVTTRNYQAMQFQRNVIYIVPIVILFGVAAWGYIRALEQKNNP